MFKTFHFRFFKVALSIFALSLAGCGGGGGGEKNHTASLPQINSSLASSAATSAPQVSSASAASIAASTFKNVSIAAPSLSENFIGEVAQRPINIYLPKAYFTSETPLPVVYFLPGFGDTYMLDVSIPQDFDKVFNTYQPTIVVIISGVNLLSGSFFVDSAGTGKWADYVLKDVVGYVDANYRTLAKPESRGIAGHSMGGFGALDLAMRHPDIFGSVFSLSPGLVDASGIVDTQIFASDTHIKSFIAAMPSLNSVTALKNSPYIFDIAYGVAFAPLSTPPYFEYPYTLVNNILVRDEAIWAKWEAGFGAIHSEVDNFKDNLKSLNGIQLDCGTNDEYQWIYRGCNYYDAELTAAGIEHTYNTYSGFHQDKIRERILDFMLPFFSQRLATQ
ncbi:MAG: alpha/beta hydrolase-fold protein [Pseudomonadota bacterium]